MFTSFSTPYKLKYPFLFTKALVVPNGVITPQRLISRTLPLMRTKFKNKNDRSSTEAKVFILHPALKRGIYYSTLESAKQFRLHAQNKGLFDVS